MIQINILEFTKSLFLYIRYNTLQQIFIVMQLLYQWAYLVRQIITIARWGPHLSRNVKEIPKEN